MTTPEDEEEETPDAMAWWTRESSYKAVRDQVSAGVRDENYVTKMDANGMPYLALTAKGKAAGFPVTESYKNRVRH